MSQKLKYQPYARIVGFRSAVAAKILHNIYFFYSFSKRAESVLGIVPRIMRFANVFQLSRYSYNHLEIIFLFI